MSGTGNEDAESLLEQWRSRSTGGTPTAPTAQPTPTSGAYTRSNFPYADYARDTDFDYGKTIRDDDRREMWDLYVSGGSKWTPGNVPGAVQPTTIPPFMPGNQSAIAQQLGMGYGLPASDFMQSPLMQLFQPMTLSPTFTPPKTTKTKDDDDDDRWGH